jgi:hypothetical protein
VWWRYHQSLASSHSGARELTGWDATERGEHGDLNSGLTGARATVEMWRDGGNEQRWLGLSVRAKEGARELGREGERGGEGWGCSSPFIGAKGAPGRGGQGGNGWH